jgi:hypothetical protein
MFRSISRFTRGKTVAGLGALAVAIALVLGSAAPGIAQAGGFEAAGKWGGAIDPDALQILKQMTDYLGNSQRFSMHTENTFEDVLATGQKIQFHYSSDIVGQRPDKLRAERSDGDVSHIFVYDGETLSMYLGEQDFYANIEVPDNLDDFLHFARDALDLVPPAGDMVFSNAFELLTAGMTSGFVVGKAVIGGVSCDHIAFTTPVVDWQVWVADGDKPLPYKYVLTTRDDPAQPQSVTLISDWNTDPKIEDGLFELKPPPTATEIEFIRFDVVDTSVR